MGSCKKCGSEFTPMSHACERDKDALSALRARVAELERERDNADAALRLATGLCDELESRASAAESRVKRLEEALREAEKWIVGHDGESESCGCSYCTMLDRIRAALAASGTEKPRCVCVGAECHHLTGGPCACGCQTPWDESQEDNEE